MTGRVRVMLRIEQVVILDNECQDLIYLRSGPITTLRRMVASRGGREGLISHALMGHAATGLFSALPGSPIHFLTWNSDLRHRCFGPPMAGQMPSALVAGDLSWATRFRQYELPSITQRTRPSLTVWNRVNTLDTTVLCFYQHQLWFNVGFLECPGRWLAALG